MAIKVNNPHDVSKCCTEMFQLWLNKSSNPTWNQLIHALKEVELNRIADKIEGMLMTTKEPMKGFNRITDKTEGMSMTTKEPMKSFNRITDKTEGLLMTTKKPMKGYAIMAGTYVKQNYNDNVLLISM